MGVSGALLWRPGNSCPAAAAATGSAACCVPAGCLPFMLVQQRCHPTAAPCSRAQVAAAGGTLSTLFVAMMHNYFSLGVVSVSGRGCHWQGRLGRDAACRSWGVVIPGTA